MKGKKTGGRGKGTPNKATLAKQARLAKYESGAIEPGCEPLDVMLDNMRWALEEARTESDPAKALRLRTYAQTCASDAAPYLHPRPATVVQKGDLDATTRTSIEVCSSVRRDRPVYSRGPIDRQHNYPQNIEIERREFVIL
jgi:hypothetical protein